ncbi:hypothetical protein KQX54_012690 [Cotesia glomerata]|uniref:Uncharacterized protein n=1 Tax=Cotesia glomerata TaxID=32391 RepID=A0AAV7HWV3_COTGL|nr:hypothetical protein KQX54_012690 [Cotesia glomerata]
MIVKLRLMTYDHEFVWDNLKKYDHQMWKRIAAQPLLKKRRKTIKSTYRRFLKLSDDYERYTEMSPRDQLASE